MAFGINEVAPRRENELLMMVILISISGIANAYIFGEMALLVYEYDCKNLDLQENLDDTNTTMYELQITGDVQDKIRTHLKAVNSNMIEQQEAEEFRGIVSKGQWKQVC